MNRSTSTQVDPLRSTNSISADRLVEDLGVVLNWPQMAKHFSLAIATIRSHERESASLREQLDARDKRIAELESEMALVVEHFNSEPMRLDEPAA